MFRNMTMVKMTMKLRVSGPLPNGNSCCCGDEVALLTPSRQTAERSIVERGSSSSQLLEDRQYRA